MTSAIYYACAVLFCLSAPILLAARAIWPKRFSWWSVVLSAAGAGWLLLYVAEKAYRATPPGCPEMYGRTDADCIGVIVEYANSYNFEFGWLKSLVYLVIWLPVYGMFQFFRRRGGAQTNS